MYVNDSFYEVIALTTMFLPLVFMHVILVLYRSLLAPVVHTHLTRRTSAACYTRFRVLLICFPQHQTQVRYDLKYTDHISS